jgi:DNA-binding transcriptional regulator GbsR (MarR family)
VSERDEHELARFVERFALDLAEAGFPRMPARVLVALLATESGSATAAELGASLQVSAAAVSGAVRYLGQLELVTKEREPGVRQDRYRVSSDLWYEAVQRKDKIYARWSETLSDGVRAAGIGSEAAARLDDTRRFFEFVSLETPVMMSRWRAIRERAQPRPAPMEPEVR